MTHNASTRWVQLGGQKLSFIAIKYPTSNFNRPRPGFTATSGDRDGKEIGASARDLDFASGFADESEAYADFGRLLRDSLDLVSSLQLLQTFSSAWSWSTYW